MKKYEYFYFKILAISERKYPILKYIVEAIKPNPAFFDRFGDNALHLAIKSGEFEIVKLFGDLVSGSQIDTQDSSGTTPLMMAVERSDTKFFQYFVEKGANFGILNDSGSNLFHIACLASSNPSIIRSLFSHQELKVNHLNSEGETPLHLAIQKGHLPTLTLLLEHPSIDVNLLNLKGISPLHLAVEKNSLPIVKLLLDKKADLKLVDLKGRTALDVAKEKNLQEIIQLLQTLK